MARFEPVANVTRTFGSNSFVEVSRKRLVEESGASSEFLTVTRGFFESDGGKRWTRFVTLPDDPEVRQWLAEALLTL